MKTGTVYMCMTGKSATHDTVENLCLNMGRSSFKIPTVLWCTFCLSLIIMVHCDLANPDTEKNQQCPEPSQKSCSEIPDGINHGSVQQSVDDLGEKLLDFSCDPGWALKGKSILTCDCTQWSDPFPVCVPKDCLAHLDAGRKESGIYGINPNGKKVIYVYCNMTNEKEGWTVIQRRVDGSVNFYRGWKDYQQGFGDPKGNFWIGLDNLHELTNTETELHIYMQVGPTDHAFARYKSFYIGNAEENYVLWLSGYHGTAGDSFVTHNGQQFSTFDSDHDTGPANCAKSHQGAWWYTNCHHSNLNGRYGQNSSRGVVWLHYKGHGRSLKYVEMKIKRVI